MSSGKKVAQAAGMLMIAMLLSRALGFVREAALASSFGKTGITDAFIAAFTIPDFMYDLLVGGMLSSAFIPVFTSYLATDREDEAWNVASTMINLIIITVAICITLGMIFTGPLTKLVAYKFSGPTLDLAIKLTRIMFPAFIILAVNGLTMGLLQSYKHFAAPAIGAIAYNACIIIFGLLFAKRFAHLGIAAFAIGVVVGHIVNMCIQMPVLMKKGFKYRFVLDIKHPGVKKMFLLMVPAMLGLAANRVNLIVNQNFASGISEGSITALRMASRLMWLPLGVFAGSIAVAVFPTLTSQAARKEMNEFKGTLSMGIRSIFLIIIPASVGLAVLSVPIVRLLFERGEFNHSATLVTANALVFYCVGLFSQSAVWVVTRAYYAMQDLTRPLLVALSTILLNIALNYFLRPILREGGLALADSIAVTYNLMILLYILRRKIGQIGFRKILKSFVLITVSSGLMGVVVYLVSTYIGTHFDLGVKINQIIQVGVSITVGLVVFAAAILACKLEETEMVLGIVRRKLKRAA